MLKLQNNRRINLTLKCWLTATVHATTCIALNLTSLATKVKVTEMKDGQQPRIVVVGAGVAGLGAAIKLKELGFTDLTLVEASDVFGGRIAKANIGKSWVDTGAQYIHGASKENPFYCLLRKFEFLNQVHDEGNTMFYRQHGQKVDDVFAECVYETGERIIRHRGNSSGSSLGEHFAEKAQCVIEDWNTNNKEHVQSVLALVAKDYLLSIAASDLHCVSKDSWKYYVNMGDDLNVEGIMFQILEKLAEDLSQESLVLNKEVVKIEWDGSFPGSDNRVYPVRVVSKDGDEILADHVIITVSLGCLKVQASTLFNPSLTPEKMEVIDKLPFGNIAKVFLEYEEPFWPSDVSRISMIWDEDSVDSVSTNQTQWLKHLNSFTVMKPKERFGNILIAWCPGDVADMIETMPEKELSTAITEHIRIFSGIPNIPPPKSVLRTQWRTNNFTRGSYTFIPVGVDAQVMDVLAQPLVGSKDPSKGLQVLFAGEATIKTLYGTVHGALISGHREAERLAKYYGMTTPPVVDTETHI